MKIAVVGCGDRCARLLEVIQQHHFHEITPRIVGVADINPLAPGFVAAQNLGILTTTDYHDLLTIENLDLIICLTHDEAVLRDILETKPFEVRVVSHKSVQLFFEINRISVSHKKIRQELQETLTKYKMMLDELIQEDVMIINRNYKIADINKRMLNNLGLKRAEVIGYPCYEITHRSSTPCSGEHHPCPLIQTLETGQPSQTTHIHLDKDNQERYVSIATYPMTTDGEIIGAMEISRDITQDINFQKNLMQNEKLASIGRLSAGVAHEINNPLTTILTSAMLIQEDLSPDDPAYEEMQIIANEALRCRKIVTSLLDFARQTKPQKKFADINEVVNESVLLTKKQAAFKDIKVKADMEADIPELMFDKGQIEQAIINLLLNAVEATPEGGTVAISTAHNTNRNCARIIISDSGQGIDSDKINNIFEPFFTTKETGTGLGLAITHGIIEQHNGTIYVASRKGEGTTFTINLPITTEG